MTRFNRVKIIKRLRDAVDDARLALAESADWHPVASENYLKRQSASNRLDDVLEDAVDLLNDDLEDPDR